MQSETLEENIFNALIMKKEMNMKVNMKIWEEFKVGKEYAKIYSINFLKNK